MAYAMTKQGSLDNYVTYEFICDAVEDMNAIEDRYRTIGTVAIVLSGASGLEVYIAGSDKQWNSLSSIGGSAASDTAGLSIYICAQDEVSEGVPDVELPDEQTLYLVPAAEPDSGNLYDEYIYVEGEWEKFGSGGSAIDLSAYATKASPVFTGSISLGRASGSTIGENSVAEGNNVVASGNYSHAEGNGEFEEGPKTIDNNTYTTGGAYGYASHVEGYGTLALNYHTHAEGQETIASGNASHAEGFWTTASGGYSHAEGNWTTASNDNSHAEGNSTTASSYDSHAEGSWTTASGGASHAEGSSTTASGGASHAEGSSTTASGDYSHAEGWETIASGRSSHAEGEGANASGTNSHVEGYRTIASGLCSHAEGYVTAAAGGSSHVVGRYNVIDSYTLQPAEWQQNTHYNVGDKVTWFTADGTSIFTCIVSNTDQTFDWSHWALFGDINYVEIVGNGFEENNRSNARALDWEGNEHLKGDIYVGCNANSTGGTKLPRIPEAPSTDGTYILQATVTNGTPTYSWVSAG